jgi:hypothetical protein
MTVWEEEKSVMIKAFFICVICDANGARVKIQELIIIITATITTTTTKQE